MLADAKLMLENGRLKSAADRAYYTMFHAAQAAVSQEVARLPRSHKGLRTLFAQHFVGTNRVPRALSRDLTFAFELRQASSYEVSAEFGEGVVKETVERAEDFIVTIRQVLNMA